jgi:hypothetical protein
VNLRLARDENGRYLCVAVTTIDERQRARADLELEHGTGETPQDALTAFLEINEWEW